MKVEELNRQSINNLQRDEKAENSKPADAGQKDTTVQARQKADKIALSTGVDRFRAAKDAISSQPDFRAERVQEIKSSIDAGTYKVSSIDVAGKMLAATAAGTRH